MLICTFGVHLLVVNLRRGVGYDVLRNIKLKKIT